MFSFLQLMNFEFRHNDQFCVTNEKLDSNTIDFKLKLSQSEEFCSKSEKARKF
jgi:hypothetical protein